MLLFNCSSKKNIETLKQVIRVGQIVPCRIVKIFSDRELLVRVRGVEILAYADLKADIGDKLYLRVEQIKHGLKFKLISADEFEKIKNGGIDYTI